VEPGDFFTINLQLRNDGWAAPFNPRPVELVLRHTGTGDIHTVPLSDEDPRFWLAGDTQTLVHTIRAPELAGDYELLVNLPDPEPALRDRLEYSIRLANENVWESETGYNKLNRTVTVHEPQDPPRCDTDEATIYVNINGIIVGGPDDGLIYGNQVTELRGTVGSDVIVGTNEADIIRGRGGRDTVCGMDGNDILYGGGGSDNLFGGNGDDILHGGKGPDKLEGNADEDTLYGNAGADELFGGPGIDIANGNGGWDFCTGSETVNTCEE
jgi:hypothetical protein